MSALTLFGSIDDDAARARALTPQQCLQIYDGPSTGFGFDEVPMAISLEAICDRLLWMLLFEGPPLIFEAWPFTSDQLLPLLRDEQNCPLIQMLVQGQAALIHRFAKDGDPNLDLSLVAEKYVERYRDGDYPVGLAEEYELLKPKLKELSRRLPRQSVQPWPLEASKAHQPTMFKSTLASNRVLKNGVTTFDLLIERWQNECGSELEAMHSLETSASTELLNRYFKVREREHRLRMAWKKALSESRELLPKQHVYESDMSFGRRFCDAIQHILCIGNDCFFQGTATDFSLATYGESNSIKFSSPALTSAVSNRLFVRRELKPPPILPWKYLNGKGAGVNVIQSFNKPGGLSDKRSEYLKSRQDYLLGLVDEDRCKKVEDDYLEDIRKEANLDWTQPPRLPATHLLFAIGSLAILGTEALSLYMEPNRSVQEVAKCVYELIDTGLVGIAAGYEIAKWFSKDATAKRAFEKALAQGEPILRGNQVLWRTTVSECSLITSAQA